ncbi:MAG: DMT family transporter [Phycisphaerales bacterium]|nr:DMT family transporter [Phycisphaerales bacterium]
MNGTVLAVLAGACWGIGEVFTKSVLHTGRVGPLTAIAVRSTVAIPVLWIVYWIFVQQRRTEPTTWLADAGGGTLAKLILGSGLIAGAAGMVLFYSALKTGEISRVKPIAFTVAPMIGVLLGWLVLGEPMTAKKIVAIALVMSGVVLLTTG